MSFNDAFTVLTTPPPSLSEESAAYILRDHYGIEGMLKSLAGERDRNFVVRQASGEDHLLKIANSAEAPEITDFQTAALLHVEKIDTDLPVPRVIPTIEGDSHVGVFGDDGRAHTARLLTWLDGMPISFLETRLDKAEQLGALLARLGIALKNFEHPAADYSLLWDLKQAGNLIELLDNVRNDSLRALCWQRLQRFTESTRPVLLKLRTQVIYNDLNPSNVLVDPNNPDKITGIIDFGDMVKSPLVADIAVGAAYLCAEGEEPLSAVARFLIGYNRARRLDIEEFELLHDLILTRNVMSIIISNWRATQYPENRDYILRSEPRAKKTIEKLANIRQSEVTDMFLEACRR